MIVIVKGRVFLVFNTKRLYSKEGQRMIATMIEDGVLFFDHDRGIDGYIPYCKLKQDDIMEHYDKNEYSNDVGCMPHGYEIHKECNPNAWENKLTIEDFFTETAKMVGGIYHEMQGLQKIDINIPVSCFNEERIRKFFKGCEDLGSKELSSMIDSYIITNV